MPGLREGEFALQKVWSGKIWGKEVLDNVTLESLSAFLSLWHQGPTIRKTIALVVYDERYIPKSDRDLQRAFKLFKELDITEIQVIPFTPSILYGAIPQLGVRCSPSAMPKAYNQHRSITSDIQPQKAF